MEGNQTLTLALVWQLMRAYTLSLLSKLNEDGTPIVESEIISWANNKVCGPSHCFFIGVDRKVGQHQKWFVLSSTNNCMSSKEIYAYNTFPVDRGGQELTNQAFPRQEQQDGNAHYRPHRRHENWGHWLRCRQDWLEARWRGQFCQRMLILSKT